MSYSESLRDHYKQADRDSQYEHNWGYVNPVAAAYWRMRDEIVFENITNRFDTLRDSLRVLEVGVGHGHELAKLSQLGIPTSHLCGIDLVLDRLVRASVTYPSIGFSQQDGTRLAFRDATFDIVCQFTCVMHAFSKELQLAICQEMNRVLKPGGIVVWWDIAPIKGRTSLLMRLCRLLSKRQAAKRVLSAFKDAVHGSLRRSHPGNAEAESTSSYILPIASQEIVQMFQGLRVDVKCVGVNYDMWEYLWRISRSGAQILWRTGWFYQHCFAVIEKPAI